MIGIRIDSCYGGTIKNVNFTAFDTAISASNTYGLTVNNLNMNNCKRGVVLNHCWEADVRNIYFNPPWINHSKYNTLFQLNELAIQIKYFMLQIPQCR